jgi:DNA-binding Lrp family transcriptional regulator
MADELDKGVINLIQGDLHLEHRPFALLADKIGLSEREFKKTSMRYF